MSKENKSEIIPAESGPIKADRHATYHVTYCQCGELVYFFKTERWSNCFKCGVWTAKPKNGQAMTL